MLAHPISALLLLVFGQASPNELRASAPPAEVRAAFLQLLDRPKVALDVKAEPATREKGLVTERLSFATEKKPDGSIERVPALIVRPHASGARRPAVVVLHGTGGQKEGLRPWLLDLARLGFVAVAIDGRYHGERLSDSRGTAAYNAAIVRAWRAKPGEPQEHPFYYDTCWDLWRTLDYLGTRDDVDPRRIGVIGFSKGGIETWLAAAADERIAVAIPAIGVQSFRWGLENDHWQKRAQTIGAAHEAAAKDLGEPQVNAEVCRRLWSKVIPGILGPFDGPSMLRLIAPRPLMILNGELDPNCPIEGARLAFKSAKDAYLRAGAPEHLEIIVAEGVGHTVTPAQRQQALDWFARWLKPEPR